MLALPLVAVVVGLFGMTPASGTASRSAASTAAAGETPLDPGLAKLQRLAAGAPAPTTRSSKAAPSGGVHAAATPSSTTVADPANDATSTVGAAPSLLARADIADPTNPSSGTNAASINVGAQSIRLSVKIPQTTNPTTDFVWRAEKGHTGITWALSVGPTIPSGNIDFLANITADKDGHLIGGVFTPVAGHNPAVNCYANASWDGAATFSISFSSACIGSPANLQFYAEAVYDTSLGSDTNPSVNQPHDFAPNVTLTPESPQFSAVVSPGTAATPDAGGYVADRFGEIRPFGITGTPPGRQLSNFFPVDIVRGFAMFPDGGHGFVLDGRGGLWGAALGQNQLPIGPIGNAYWTWDIARGVAIMPNGAGGLVVDGLGGLHWFSIGASHPAPAINGGPYWPNWDIARGVVILPDASGGFVLDAWGALHPFGLGSSLAPSHTPTGGPYWKGWYIARGVTLLPDGSAGYVGDDWGVRHPFSLTGPAPATSGGPYWPNQSVARGPSVVWGALPLP